MAPRRVGADQHQQIGLVEIFVAAGHGVGAEGAAMAGDRGRHAQPRIGIDIGAADESLHQLVGDVIVLGQHLPGQIERDRVRAVARDDVRKAMRDMVERVAPGHPLHDALAAADHRIEQAVLKTQGFAERRALRAQPSEIGGMFGIARYRRAAVAVRLSPARRSRRRNRDRSCAWRASAGSTPSWESSRSSDHAAFDGIASARPNIMSVRIRCDRLAVADQFEIPERIGDIADQHRAGRAGLPRSPASCRCRA